MLYHEVNKLLKAGGPKERVLGSAIPHSLVKIGQKLQRFQACRQEAMQRRRTILFPVSALFRPGVRNYPGQKCILFIKNGCDPGLVHLTLYIPKVAYDFRERPSPDGRRFVPVDVALFQRAANTLGKLG